LKLARGLAPNTEPTIDLRIRRSVCRILFLLSFALASQLVAELSIELIQYFSHAVSQGPSLMNSTSLLDGIVNHWHIWFVSAVLVVAAVIDGWKLKVPNWITFPMIATGWIYSFASGGWAGLGWSVLATFFGLALLYGIYMVGGMGAGDVKLLAGIGAWVHAEHTWNIFATTAIVGGIMAILMIAYSGRWKKHFQQFNMLIGEFVEVKDPEALFQRAAERKPRMYLLPYGVPMTIAALGYFAFNGMYL
jgi:prepilin peptidase CpaA